MSANILPHIDPETICVNQRLSDHRGLGLATRPPRIVSFTPRIPKLVPRQQLVAENLDLAFNLGYGEQTLIALPYEPFGMDVLDQLVHSRTSATCSANANLTRAKRSTVTPDAGSITLPL